MVAFVIYRLADIQSHPYWCLFFRRQTAASDRLCIYLLCVCVFSARFILVFPHIFNRYVFQEGGSCPPSPPPFVELVRDPSVRLFSLKQTVLSFHVLLGPLGLKTTMLVELILAISPTNSLRNCHQPPTRKVDNSHFAYLIRLRVLFFALIEICEWVRSNFFFIKNIESCSPGLICIY